MKIKEITEKVTEAIKKHEITVPWHERAEDGYDHYGLRFENKKREVGEICENSRHNWGRADERDFPEYGTSDYNDMQKLDGTSAWNISQDGETYWQKSYTGWGNDPNSDGGFFGAEHCYIIAGDFDCTHSDCDNSEIVIESAIVLEVIF